MLRLYLFIPVGLNESELCAMCMWMDVYDRATSRHKLIAPTSGHPEG